MRSSGDIQRGVMVLGLILALLTTVFAPARAAGVDVAIRPSADVSGDRIFLRDIAVLSGPDCAFKEDLASVFITKAPSPGQRTTIHKSYLAHRLRASGLPLSEATWQAPESVVVTRRAQSLNREWVERAVRAHLSAHEPYKSGQWELLDVRVGALPALPDGDLEYQATARSSRPTRLTLTLFLSVDGRPAGRVRAAARVKLIVPAVVAARRLERGHVITPGDLKPARISLDLVKEGALTDPAQAVGQSCRRRISPGRAVTERDLVPPKVIQRGDMVTIIAQTGALKVSTRGQAKQDGAIGDNIMVMNLNSKKTVPATVVASGAVKVNF